MKYTKVTAKIVITLTALLVCVFLQGCGSKESAKTDPKASKQAAQPNKKGGESTSPYSEYLTTAEVEKVSSLTGLMAVVENTTLSFKDSTGKVVYEARFYDNSFYEEEIGGNREYYTDVEGVGDKAAICIPDSPYRLTFAKGGHSVMTQVLSKDDKGQWLLSEEQLISLAKIIASKM